MDFTNLGSAAEAINGWIAVESGGKFTEIVAGSGLGNGPHFDICCGMNFHGIWKNEFNTQFSYRGAPFYQLDGSEMQVNRMHACTQLRNAYFPDLEAQGVLVPFEE